MTSVSVEVVRIVPALAWVAFAVAALLILKRPLIDLLSRTRSAKIPGFVDLQFGETLERAAGARDQRLPREARTRVVRRAHRNVEAVAGARVLWIDDHPSWNKCEARALRDLSIQVDTAESTDEGLELVTRYDYDVVVSDIARGDDRSAGVRALDQLRHRQDPIGSSSTWQRSTRVGRCRPVLTR